MADYNDSQELYELSIELVRISREIQVCLKDCAQLQVFVDKLLATNLEKMMEKKKNLGHEMAILMLIRESAEAGDAYTQLVLKRAECKGLETVKDALTTQITTVWSLLKHQAKQTN